MPEILTMLSFAAAALLVLIIPGPGFFYILARSLAQGRRAGLVSVIGLSVGAMAHVVAATVGLSAILLSSATAFTVVKILGAAYLIYLGLRTLFSRQPIGDIETVTSVPTLQLFTDGILVSVLNPKIGLFFLAFLPQFVNSGVGNVPQQVMILGMAFVVLALFVDGIFALLASSLHQRLRGKARDSNLPRFASGTVFIGLGIGAAFIEPPAS